MRASVWAPLAILALGLLATFGAWREARRDAQADARRQFEFRVAEIRTAVLARMRAQEQVLRGARGLIEASEAVTRDAWRRYVTSLALDQSYPGIQGVGFALRIAPARLAAHEAAVRAEGYPNYAVRPPGPRAEYTSIVYLEPFDWRNQRAFGYDMYSEPVRRRAMERARDTGLASVSGAVTLVQETEHDVQAGCLMYLPLYRRGAPITSVAGRRAALVGYAYSPLRMRDLMRGILGHSLSDVALRIDDGSTLMYESAPGAAGHAPRFAQRLTLDIHGHPWRLTVSSLPRFEAGIHAERARLTAWVGSLASLLLAGVVWSLATLRERAQRLARRMTAALRESREQFRAVADTALDAIVSADATGGIIYCNQAAERMFGHPAPALLGQSITRLMPERYRQAHEDGMKRYLATGEAHILGRLLELTALRQDGGEFPIEISLVAWHTAGGRFFTAILRDIGERRRAQAQIRALNDNLAQQVAQLAEANQELESFSYSVSHDLRAPLRAVDGFALLLEEGHGPALDAEGRRLLGVIRRNSARMQALIDDLLAFSRLARVPVSPAPVDMAALAREALDELREGGETGTGQVTIGAMPCARGDRALLRQVWLNLIGNALKYSRPKPAPAIEAGGTIDGDETVYYVRDNGVGFDMRYADKLFGVFQRLHGQDEFPGTGVGLAIVRRVVSRHGGRAWAEGRVGEGAVFHFALPAGAAPCATGP